MTLIDNGISVNMMLSKNDPDLIETYMNNIAIFGESPIEDRVDGVGKCQDKFGFMLSYFALKPKPPYPRSTVLLPIRKIKSDAAWGGKTLFENVRFIDFPTNNTGICNKRRGIFTLNPFGADYYPQQIFDSAEFENVHEDGLGFLMDPNIKWANSDDCGNFPCTAPLNVEMLFTNTNVKGG